MCKDCGNFNYEKRIQRKDLSGYSALITGGRIKIGFQTAKLLLEMGADVTVTTRFPNNAYKRYAELPDFPSFKDRLHIIAADFRSLASIQSLLLKLKSSPLDILINNAAQTVRKPAPFYKHLIKEEEQKLAVPNIISTPKQTSNNALILQESFLPNLVKNNLTPAQMSQIPMLPEDYIDSASLFPPDMYDKDGQQRVFARLTAGCMNLKTFH